ncbi:uncharacterized protein G6M90_00g062640 [Metarhizium brunneum]|uniref:Uncharacterized protein n=1 Tax=Metarhizium brunneum TaxID=500148 RepID=A0A7D5UYC8_9HYPO
MATWTITKIEAENRFNVVTSGGITIPLGNQTVWNNTGSWVDGPTGSTRPNVFLNTMPTATGFYKINVHGTAPFSAIWRGKSYVVAGHVGGRLALISPLVPVPATGNAVAVNGLYLMAPDFKTRQVVIPFRYGGDFSWQLWLWNGKEYIASMAPSTTTRLELCWARATAPTGPVTAPSPTVRTRVDMTPGYPILLWRLFAPNPSELPAAASQDVAFYIHRAVVNVIWNASLTTPRYDTSRGMAYYGVSGYGGGFKLKEWFDTLYPRCNCYDLAGISQLALSMLMDANGAELTDSHWVFQSPNGFINPGPLIRWVASGGDNLRCNTPFWESAGTAPYVPPTASNRTSFGNHAWVEVTRSGVTTVVDATHALQAPTPTPPAGTQTRQDYITATLDPARPRGNAQAKTTANPSGSCSLNPSTSLQRIGVYNPWGRPAPLSAMIPEELAKEIETLVEKGKVPDAAKPEFNRVDVQDATLRSAVSKNLAAAGTTTSVFETSSHTTYAFRHGSDTATVTIDAFEDFEGPMHALVSLLASIQIHPLSAVVHTDGPRLGAYSFRTATSAFWIRGNLFIHAQYFSSEPEPKLELEVDISALAADIDAQLASREAAPHLPTGIKPDWASLPDVVHIGKELRVAVDTDRFASMTSFSDNIEVLVPRGPPDEEGRFVFYARAAGKAKATIAGAAKGSLQPLHTSFDITVAVEHPGTTSVEAVEAPPGDLPPMVPDLPSQE